MQAPTLFILFSLFIHLYGQDVQDNVHKKLDEIESRIANDLQKKYGGNVDDIKQQLADRINGPVDKLIEKINKEQKKKNQPSVDNSSTQMVQTKSVVVKAEAVEGNLNDIIGALEEAKISVKEEGKERIQEYINYLKKLEQFLNETEKPKAEKDGKEAGKDDVQKTEDKIDDFLEDVTEDEQADSKNQDFLELVKRVIRDLEARRELLRMERAEHLHKIFDAFKGLKKNFEKKAQQKAKRQRKHFEQFIEALKTLTAEFETNTAPKTEASAVIQEFSVSISLTPSQKREKLQKIQELKDQIEALLETEKTKEKERRKELFDQLRPFLKQKVDRLREKANIIKEQKAQRVEAVKEFWTEFGAIMDEIRTVLDTVKEQEKAKKKAVIDELKEVLTAAVEAVEQSQNQMQPMDNGLTEAAITANQQIKATFLDNVTGVSSWQTVTWILLSVCMVLAVALLIAVCKQNTIRNHYDRLDGSEFADAEFESVHAIRATTKLSPGPTAPLYPKDEIKEF